ncbi:MAG: acyltransferase 3, partial [Polaromonas sp.]|nr:acyltransferase 3 [Polaromonas sp.]
TLARLLQPGWSRCLGWAVLAAVLLWLADRCFIRYGYWEQPAMLVAWRPLLGSGLCALVACSITFPAAGARWLAPLRYAGTISYGLYLWHFPVLVALVDSRQVASGPVLLACVAGATAAMAILSWHLLEKPWVQRARGSRHDGGKASARKPGGARAQHRDT